MLLSEEECRATLARSWRPTPWVNSIAAVLQRPDGAFLVSRVGSGWGLPAAYGHGVRPNYWEPLAKLAQHFHFPLQLSTLKPVGIYFDGHEDLNVVTLEVGPEQGYTPADAKWVSLEELKKLDGVSPIVDMALSQLASMRHVDTSEQVSVGGEAAITVPVLEVANLPARRSTRKAH